MVCNYMKQFSNVMQLFTTTSISNQLYVLQLCPSSGVNTHSIHIHSYKQLQIINSDCIFNEFFIHNLHIQTDSFTYLQVADVSWNRTWETKKHAKFFTRPRCAVCELYLLLWFLVYFLSDREVSQRIELTQVGLDVYHVFLWSWLI